MLVIKIETANELRNEFIKYDRDNFSYEGYEAIINFFDNFEDTELDVIAIDCEFVEANEEDIRNDYNIEEDEDVMEYLEKNTYAVKLSNDKILYVAF